MKMTVLKLFLLCTFKHPKLKEKFTNLAENQKFPKCNIYTLHICLLVANCADERGPSLVKKLLFVSTAQASEAPTEVWPAQTGIALLKFN